MTTEKETHLFEELSAITRGLSDSSCPDLSVHVLQLRSIDASAYFPCIRDGNLDQLAKLEDFGKTYIQLGKQLYAHGGVKWFKGREDMLFTSDDFEGNDKRAELCLCIFQILLEKVHASQGGTNFPDVYKKVVQTWCIYSILLAAEHVLDGPNLWSNPATMEAAVRTMKSVSVMCSSTLENILTHPDEGCPFNGGLLVPILSEIKPRLTKETWKENPSLKHVYMWLLFETKSPKVGEHLDYLLPPPLMFLDHHHVENKVIGVKCIKHILAETSSSEIQWYGRADVIYQALQLQLYQHEPELLQELLPCLLTILKITELTTALVQKKVQTEDRFDEIMPRILSDMETETRIIVRREYTKHLKNFIEILGIRTVKYYKRLLRVISSFLEIYDGPDETARLNILDALAIVIQVTWPRVPKHAAEICKIIIKLMWDISTDNSLTPDAVKQNVFSKAECSLIWLRRACHEQTDELIKSVLNIERMPVKVRSSLQEITAGENDVMLVS